MKTSDLVFIGIKGSVVALDRGTGRQVWATHLKGSDLSTSSWRIGRLLPRATAKSSALIRSRECPLAQPAQRLWQGTGHHRDGTQSGNGNAPVLAAKRRRDEDQLQRQ